MSDRFKKDFMDLDLAMRSYFTYTVEKPPMSKDLEHYLQINELEKENKELKRKIEILKAALIKMEK